MKQFMLGLAIGALVVFSSQQYFSQPDISTSAPANSPVIATLSPPENKTPIALIAPSGLQQTCVPVANKPNAEKAKPVTAEANSELENLRAQVQMLEQRREFEKLAQPGKADALPVLARKEFEQELIDSNWASQYQNQLANFFRSNDQLHDLVPQSIECRASRCRISIAVANQQQFNQVSGQLISTITSGEHSDITAKVLVSPEMEQGMLQLYVARDQQVSLIP